MNEAPLTLPEKRIGEFFRISVILKGVHALLEVIGGILLLIITPESIVRAVEWLVHAELLEDPHDVISNYLLSASSHLSISSTTFGALYLLSHGLVKIVLVAGLLRNKIWAYPWSLGILSIFILYQVYRYTFTHSLGLIALTVFDLVVMWLIWKEYKIMQKHHMMTV